MSTSFTLFDYFGITIVVLMVVVIGWKSLFYGLPRSRAQVARDVQLHTVLLNSVNEMQNSILESERKLERLKRLTRLAQESGDAELMQETLMMYSEETESLKSERERLTHFEGMLEAFASPNRK